MQQKTQFSKIKHYSLILVNNFFMKTLLLTSDSVLYQLIVNTPYGTFPLPKNDKKYIEFLDKRLIKNI